MCAMYNVQCIHVLVYTSTCTMCAVCIMYRYLQCTVCTIYNVRCVCVLVYTSTCTVCTMYNVQYVHVLVYYILVMYNLLVYISTL